MQLLLVDDVIETTHIFRLFFAQHGHTMETAHNGLEALRVIEANPDQFDAIVIDYHMPGIDGIEVVRQLRQKVAPVTTPVLMFTAYNQEEVVAQVKNLQVSRVLQKPIAPSDLMAIVEEIIGRRDESLR